MSDSDGHRKDKRHIVGFYLQAHIDSFQIRQQPSPHVVYQVQCAIMQPRKYPLHAVDTPSKESCLLSWTVHKRYSQFESVHATLLKKFPHYSSRLGNCPIELPTKHLSLFGFSSNFDNEKLLQRQKDLESYIQKVNQWEGPWRHSSVWLDFLQVPRDGGSLQTLLDSLNKVDSTGTLNHVSQKNVPTGETWLSEYRELVSLCAEIRSKHQPSSFNDDNDGRGSKRTLSVSKNLSTLIVGIQRLEAGLKLEEEAQKSEKDTLLDKVLTPSELFRRQDLLLNLKTEKDILHKTPSSQSSSLPSQSILNASNSYQNDRRALFGSPSGSHVGSPNTGRRLARNQRKFGLSPKETEITQNLDNEGLLKLQKTMMHEQDQALSQFSQVLSRQKQIGQAIGDELDAQIQLLADVEEGVNKVSFGVKTAEKKMDKIFRG